MQNIPMIYTSMNCQLISRFIFIATMLATSLSAVSGEDYPTGVRNESCKLYDIEIPVNLIREYPFDANGMPPVRGTLLYDDTGGETKCHLSYQSWQYIDLNHLDDTQHCVIYSYRLPKGGEPEIELLKGIENRNSNHPKSSKWIKIERGYMKSAYVKNRGMKMTKKGIEKVITHDRSIKVLLEGREYMHLLDITVPENRYRTDEKFRGIVDNIWKNWKLKK